MSDLISREAVLEFEEYVGEPATWDKPYPKGDLYVKSEIIERIPSAEPQWIPCSERLPDKEGRYLCTYFMSKGNVIDFGWFENGEWYICGCVAWMPLPEPYRGDSE